MTTYTYDTQEAGDLYQRTAPKPNQASGTVTATYTHDALHRLTGVSYNDGITSSVGYSYDQASVWNVSLGSSKGRLSSASVAGVTNRIFGYGAVGRVVVDGQCTPQNCGTTNFVANYAYNYIGEPLTGSDIQGAITWTNTYNPMGQLTQVYTNWLSPTQTGDIVSGVAYNALGQPTSDLLGNSVQETWTYNNNTTLASYNASYNGSSLYSYTPTWFATELTGVNDSLNGNWSYTYDDFDRVHTANQTGGQSLSFAYDRWGNRWGQIANVTQYSYDQHNHIISGGITYDAAGNITYDGFHSYTYEAENRVIKVDNGSTATYTYDAFGGRNSSVVSGTSTEYLFDPQGRSITAIPAGTTHIRYGEVYAGNRHWVTDNGSALFIHPDMPGTGRIWTNLNGGVAQTCTSLPFGDNLTCNVGLSNVHFTGQIHDGESNLEHFPFRQYAGLEGRWLTPDPAGVAVMDVTNPQTWNRYAYVMNNPLSFIDPTGLACWPLEKQMFGSCAPFMNNGVNFGSNWNEFDLFNIPITSHTYTPAQPISTPIDQIRDPFGEATSVTMYIPGGWSTTQIGNGWELFGEIGTAFAGVVPPGMNGAVQAQKNAAQWFGKQAPKFEQVVSEVRTWADNTPLDWERDFMSEDTQQMKELLDGTADFLHQAGDFIESNRPELETDITLIIP